MQIATHECSDDTQATIPPLRSLGMRLVVICITSSMQVYVYVCIRLCVFICVYSCMHILITL